MPTDPNARRDKTLEAILKSVNKTNDLILAQTKVLEKMAQHSRPQAIVTQHPYLERTDGGTVNAGSSSSGSGEGLGSGIRSGEDPQLPSS